MSSDDISVQPESMRPKADFYTPKYRQSYPLPLLLAVGVSTVLAVLIASYAYTPLKPYLPYTLGGAVLAVILWWGDTKRALRRRRPPKGWKSLVRPKMLVHLSLDDFAYMRWELSGANDDPLDEHEVPWASRYSPAFLYYFRSLVALACVCGLGAVLAPHLTLPAVGGGLPERYHIVEEWLIAAGLLLLAAGYMRLEWNYARLLLDESSLYDLKENPAWMPWLPGRKNAIPLMLIESAEPFDNAWGNRCGHGTVKLTYVKDGVVKTRYFRHVPQHRDCCNAINDSVVKFRTRAAGIIM